jgi:diacylglycerol kinase family enzyme
MNLYNIGRRLILDNGFLSVYLLRRSGRVGLLLLVLHTVFGRLRQLKDFEGFKTTKLTIATRKKRILVALDGEVTVMETPLRYQIHPKKLRVLVPQSEV